MASEMTRIFFWLFLGALITSYRCHAIILSISGRSFSDGDTVLLSALEDNLVVVNITQVSIGAAVPGGDDSSLVGTLRITGGRLTKFISNTGTEYALQSTAVGTVDYAISVSASPGVIFLVPLENFSGAVNFQLIFGGDGLGSSVVISFAVTITPVPDAPSLESGELKIPYGVYTGRTISMGIIPVTLCNLVDTDGSEELSLELKHLDAPISSITIGDTEAISDLVWLPPPEGGGRNAYWTVYSSISPKDCKVIEVRPIWDPYAVSTFTLYLTLTSTEISTGQSASTIVAINSYVMSVYYTTSSADSASFDLTEHSGVGSITMNLQAEPSSDVFVNLAVESSSKGGVQRLTISPSLLKFSKAQWSTKQVITVQTLDNFVHECDDVPVDRIIVTCTSASDARFNEISLPAVVVRILNDDVASVEVSESAFNVLEGGLPGVFYYFIQLTSEPLADVTLTLVVENSDQLTVQPAYFTVTPETWRLARFISVAGADNNVTDGARTFAIYHVASSVGGCRYDAIPVSTVAATILDDDRAALVLSSSSLVVSENAQLNDSYSLQILSAPLASVTVRVSVDSSLENIQVNPAVATFDSINWHDPIVFKVSCGNFFDFGIDDALITHEVLSEDSVYNGFVLSKIAVTIIGGAASPPPRLKACAFLSTADGVQLIFDRPGDHGVVPTSFKCHTLLDSGSIAKLGDALPDCVWVTSSVVRVTFGVGASLLVGDLLGVKGGVIKSAVATGAQLFNPPGHVPVSAPNTAPVPIVMIQAPVAVGRCSDLELDGSGSLGGGGRPLSFQWFVSSLYDTSKIMSVFKSFNPGVSFPYGTSVILIPRSSLEDGAEYHFFLQVTNFLLQTFISNIVAVRVDSSAVPLVVIEGPSKIVALRSEEIVIRIRAEAGRCVTSESSSFSLDISWHETSGLLTGLDSLDRFVVNPRVLRIPAGTLSSDFSYSFEALVSDPSNSALHSSVTATVEVQRAPLVAVIAGGNRSISSAEPLVLSAASSLDLDGSPAEFQFSWNCSIVEFNLPCIDTTTDRILEFHAESYIIVEGDVLAQGFEYFFSVVVLKDTRSSFASVRIAVQPDRPDLPKVLIASAPTQKVNPNANMFVELQGIVMSDDSYNLEWQLGGKEGDSLSNAEYPLNELFLIDRDRLSIAIDAGSLIGGTKYTFRLSSSNENLEESFASISIVVNDPPRSGSFRVLPESGSALSTSFLLGCYDWVDDVEDLPLGYEFGYQSTSGSVVPLGGKSGANRKYAYLPEGDSSRSGALVVLAYVHDRYGAFRQSFAEIAVSFTVPLVENNNFVSLSGRKIDQASVDVDTLSYLADQSTFLKQILDSRDVEKFFQFAGSLVEALNRASVMMSGKTVSSVGSLPEVGSSAVDPQVSLKDNIMGSLLNASQFMEETASALLQQAAVLQQLTATFSDLSAESQDLCLQLVYKWASSAAYHAAVDSFNSDLVVALVSSLSSLVDAGALEILSGLNSRFSGLSYTKPKLVDASRLRPRANIQLLKDSLDKIAAVHMIGVVPGMPPRVLITQNFQMTSKRETPVRISGATLSIALTDEQIVGQGMESPYFGFPFSLSSEPWAQNLAYLDIVATMFISNPFAYSDIDINSYVIRLKLFSDTGEAIEASMMDAIEFVVQNTDDFPEPSPTLFVNGSCLPKKKGPRDTVSFDCPLGLSYYTCNSTNLVTLECPVETISASCEYWDSESESWSSNGCITLNFTDAHTICRCSHLTEFSSRMRSTISEASVVLKKLHLPIVVMISDQSVVSCLVVVYIGLFVILIMARYADGRDKNLESIGITPFPQKYDNEAKAALDNIDDHGTVQFTFQNFLKRWWIGIKRRHAFISIIFTYDRIYTRSRRLMVLSLFVLSCMYFCSFLYSDDYGVLPSAVSIKDGNVALWQIFCFGGLACVTSLPIFVITRALLNKCGDEASLELIERPVEPGQTVIATKKLEEARITLNQSRLELSTLNRRFANLIKDTVHIRGSKNISVEMQVRWAAEFLETVTRAKEGLSRSSETVAQATMDLKHSSHIKRREIEHEARQVVKGLKGLAKFKEMGRVVDERLFSVRLSHLPPAERAFIRAELLELKRMKSSTQKLYKTLINPPKNPRRLWPSWIGTVVCGFCSILNAWSSIKVFEFGQRRVGSVFAIEWLLSVGFSWALYLVFLQPTGAFFTHAVFRVFATRAVAKSDTGILLFQSVVKVDPLSKYKEFHQNSDSSDDDAAVKVKPVKPPGCLTATDLLVKLDAENRPRIMPPEKLDSLHKAAFGKVHSGRIKHAAAFEDELVKSIQVDPAFEMSVDPNVVHTVFRPYSIPGPRPIAELSVEEVGSKARPRSSGSSRTSASQASVRLRSIAAAGALQIVSGPSQVGNAKSRKKIRIQMDLCPRGCGMSISPDDKSLENHLLTECRKNIPCSWSCGTWLSSWEVKVHELACTSRTVPCAHDGCNEILKEEDKEFHENNCLHARIRCTLGCSEEIKRKDRDAHIREEHQMILCPSGCGSALYAGQLDNHKSRHCALREIKCESCDMIISENVIGMHEKFLCGNKVVPCRLQCGAHIMQKDRPDHEASQCINRRVRCERCQKTYIAGNQIEHDRRYCIVHVVCECNEICADEEAYASHRTQCALRMVPCSLGCGEIIRDLEMVAHQSLSCTNRLIVCECGEQIIEKIMSTHKSQNCRSSCGSAFENQAIEKHIMRTCPRRLVKCPLGCSSLIIIAKLRMHVELDCPRRLRACPRCPAELQQRHLEKHLESECTYLPCACGMVVAEGRREIHSSSHCPERLVHCSRGCGVLLPEIERAEHEWKHCRFGRP